MYLVRTFGIGLGRYSVIERVFHYSTMTK
jgi:hypothetical protein